MLTRHGVPDIVVTDNGKQFVSVEFERFLADCDIEHVKASLYYPQSNVLERFNRSVKQAVRTALTEEKSAEEGMRNMLVTYRSTAQSATGISPSKLMSGRQMRVPSNSFAMARHMTGRVRFADQGGDVDVDAGLDEIQAHVEQHQFNMAAQFNRQHRACKPRFRVEDWVRVRVKKYNKTDAAFSEPHQIVKMVAPFTVLIDNGNRWHM
jgi:transposase InsO family protein